MNDQTPNEFLNWLDDLAKQVGENTKAIDENRSRKENQIRNLCTRDDNFRAKFRDAKESIIELEKENEGLRQQISERNKENDKLKTKNKIISEHKKTIQEAHEKLRLETRCNENAKLRARIIEREKENEQLANTNKEFRKHLRELEERHLKKHKALQQCYGYMFNDSITKKNIKIIIDEAYNA